MASWTLTMVVPTPNRCLTLASHSFQQLATSRRSSSLRACSHSCASSRTASRRRRSQDRSRNVDPHALIMGMHPVLLLDAWEPDFSVSSQPFHWFNSENLAILVLYEA